MPRINNPRSGFTFMQPVTGNPREASSSQQQREVSLTPSVSSQRDMSAAPSEHTFRREMSFATETSEVVENNPENSNTSQLRWTDDVTWVFLQIMLGIHDELCEATDNHYKARIWLNALALFKEELSNVNDSATFVSAIDVEKMQAKWDAMKRKYKQMYQEAILRTGVGGSDPATRWTFYDEVGQILVNDVSIRAEVSIETYGMNESDGPVTTDNRNREARSPAEVEAAATERARRRNVRRITSDKIKEKILDPSKRYAEVSLNEQADRHAAGLELSSSMFSTATTSTNASSSTAPATTVTGAGRTTRSSVTSEAATPAQTSGTATSQGATSAATGNGQQHRQYLEELGRQQNTLMEFLDQQRAKKLDDSFRLLGALKETLIEEDNRVLEMMSRKRRADNQDLLEQLYAMRQGHPPNLVNIDRPSSPAPVLSSSPAPVLPVLPASSAPAPVLPASSAPAPVLPASTPSVTTSDNNTASSSVPVCSPVMIPSVTAQPLSPSPATVPPSNRSTSTFITTVPEDMSSDSET